MERFKTFVIVLLSCLSCFGQKVVYTDDDEKVLARNSAILFEALSNLGYDDMMECLAIPSRPSSNSILNITSIKYKVIIEMEWQIDSGFQLKSINFSGFDKVDAKYKQQRWYKDLGLNIWAKRFKGNEITRYPILKAWWDEILRLSKSPTFYCSISPDWLPYGRENANNNSHLMVYCTDPLIYRTSYSRTDTTDLEQWIKRMKQLKLRDAFLEYEKQKKARSNNKDSHNEPKSPPRDIYY